MVARRKEGSMSASASERAFAEQQCRLQSDGDRPVTFASGLAYTWQAAQALVAGRLH